MTEDANQREPEGDAIRVDNDDGHDRVNAPSAGQLKCGICQTTFRRPEHLKRHLRSHTKEKPFECPQCSRRFSRRHVASWSYLLLSSPCPTPSLIDVIPPKSQLDSNLSSNGLLWTRSSFFFASNGGLSNSVFSIPVIRSTDMI